MQPVLHDSGGCFDARAIPSPPRQPPSGHYEPGAVRLLRRWSSGSETEGRSSSEGADERVEGGWRISQEARARTATQSRLEALAGGRPRDAGEPAFE